MNGNYIVFEAYNSDSIIRINADHIMCYYPSYDDRNFETEEYITLELIGNKKINTINVKGKCIDLDDYFRIYKFGNKSFNKLPADINNIH